MTINSADQSLVCSFKENRSIWLKQKTLLGASKHSPGRKAQELFSRQDQAVTGPGWLFCLTLTILACNI